MHKNEKVQQGMYRKKIGKKAHAFDASIQETDLFEFQASQDYMVRIIREICYQVTWERGLRVGRLCSFLTFSSMSWQVCGAGSPSSSTEDLDVSTPWYTMTLTTKEP